jgi:hypothetical protein
VCQKDALIIAVTSVFFVPFFLSDTGTEFFGRFERRKWGVYQMVTYPLPPLPRSFGIIDLEKNSCQVFGE